VLGVEAFEFLMSRYGIPNNSRIVFYDYAEGGKFIINAAGSISLLSPHQLNL
jgi:3-mercaptopyruvate sulfurtransferase SseA